MKNEYKINIIQTFTAIANFINKHNNVEIIDVDFIVCDSNLKELKLFFDYKKCNSICRIVCNAETNKIIVYKYIDLYFDSFVAYEGTWIRADIFEKYGVSQSYAIEEIERVIDKYCKGENELCE
jgi:hypothetical protein